MHLHRHLDSTYLPETPIAMLPVDPDFSKMLGLGKKLKEARYGEQTQQDKMQHGFARCRSSQISHIILFLNIPNFIDKNNLLWY